MTIVAELQVPAAQFALGETLKALPEVAVEFERVVTHSQEWVMPFLWVRGSDAALADFPEFLARDDTVDDYTRVQRFDGVDLYEVRWCKNIRESIDLIFDKKGVLIEATGGDHVWDIVVQFDGKSAISDLEDYFRRGGTDFVLKRLYTLATPRQIEYSVTAEQREALVLAAERGFFDIPRETTLSELADELQLSPSAVSERLRRGMYTLITNSLSVDNTIVSRRNSSS